MPASALADILQKAIGGTAMVADKTYDGTTSATGNIALNGVVAGDSVGAGGTFIFADRNAGIGKTVAVTDVSLSGADAGNYSVTVSGSTLATILRRAITVVANPGSKPEGTPDPDLTYGVTDGSLVAGDALTGALSRAPGETPGDYAIQQGTLDASANYRLTFVGSTLTITGGPDVNPVPPSVTPSDNLGDLVRYLASQGKADVLAELQIADQRVRCDDPDDNGVCAAGGDR